MRPLARPYLQHASRHLPQGSDPIPGLIFPPDLPTAIYTASGSVVPITSFGGGGSTPVDLDTFIGDSDIFDVSGGTALLPTGFYIAVGTVEFFTIADWSGDTSFLSLAFETSGGSAMTNGILVAPNPILMLTVMDVINIPSGTQSVQLGVGYSAGGGISPLPADLVVAKAGFARISDPAA